VLLGCEFSILTFANAQPATLNPKTLRLPTKVERIASPYPFCVPVNESVNVAFKVTQVLGKFCPTTESVQGRRIAFKKQHGFRRVANLQNGHSVQRDVEGVTEGGRRFRAAENLRDIIAL
jgi:hypothetical protein